MLINVKYTRKFATCHKRKYVESVIGVGVIVSGRIQLCKYNEDDTTVNNWQLANAIPGSDSIELIVDYSILHVDNSPLFIPLSDFLLSLVSP